MSCLPLCDVPPCHVGNAWRSHRNLALSSGAHSTSLRRPVIVISYCLLLSILHVLDSALFQSRAPGSAQHVVLVNFRLTYFCSLLSKSNIHLALGLASMYLSTRSTSTSLHSTSLHRYSTSQAATQSCRLHLNGESFYKAFRPTPIIRFARIPTIHL